MKLTSPKRLILNFSFLISLTGCSGGRMNVPTAQDGVHAMEEVRSLLPREHSILDTFLETEIEVKGISISGENLFDMTKDIFSDIYHDNLKVNR